MASCPECDVEIHVDEDVDKGDFVDCEECDSRLVVVGLDPIELDVSYEDEDDEDYYDDDDDSY